MAVPSAYELPQGCRLLAFSGTLTCPLLVRASHAPLVGPNCQLLSSRECRYGHVYLPEGSVNLGAPEFALAPGSKVGSLRQQRHACGVRSCRAS